jgi:hypothetical protein
LAGTVYCKLPVSLFSPLCQRFSAVEINIGTPPKENQPHVMTTHSDIYQSPQRIMMGIDTSICGSAFDQFPGIGTTIGLSAFKFGV